MRFGFFSNNSVGVVLRCPPGISSVADVLLVGPLLTAQLHFGRVDHDNIVSAIHVWREIDLVFSAKQLGHFGGQSAQLLSFSIDHQPLLVHSCCIGRKGFVTQCIHDLIVKCFCLP